MGESTGKLGQLEQDRRASIRSTNMVGNADNE